MYHNLIGNARLLEALEGAIASGRLAHAYIIEGASGTGKSTAAFDAAWELLLSPSQRAAADGEAYRLFTEGAYHPDLKVVSPSAAKASNTIGVDDIRAVCADIYRRPAAADHKVYIIRDAQRMNEAAQNALLKSLEEPPPYVVFFLLTTDRHTLRPTIQSRCVCLTAEPVARPELLEHLRALYPGESAEALSLAARLSAGSVGRAIELLSGEEGLHTDMKLCDEMLRAVVDRDKSYLYTKLLPRKFRRQELQSALELLKLAVRDVALAKCDPERESEYFADGGELEELSRRAILRKLLRLYEYAEETCENLQVSNANPSAALAEFIIKAVS